MQSRLRRAWLVFAAAGAAAAQRQEPVSTPLLADRGQSAFTIVVAADAPPATRRAAGELQRWLAALTGARLPIAGDSGPVPELAVLVGASRATAALGLAAAIGRMGPEQYLLRTTGGRLVIAGGEPRGTSYGVYGLLGDHLGCRWFTPSIARIPARERLALPALDEMRAPAFEYRDVFVHDCHDADWAACNRVTSTRAALRPEHGGGVAYAGFVHTFAELVPAARHFAAHPEYFALVDGERRAAGAQLCCTSEGVAALVTEAVRARLRAQPEATVASVSQNDCAGWCQCARCQELAAAEESQMAPVLQFVNRVAGALAEEFPGRLIDTLAYQWTRRPPKTMRPLPNVVVRLCSIECCFRHPFAACDEPASRAFVADLQGWARICDRLWLWNYTTDFAHYLLPFPNLEVLAPNLRLLAANHVTGVFEEGNYTSPHGEFQALRGWVLARCLWDPATDARAARDEFLDGVYGAAAPPIRRYLDALHARTAAAHVGIYQGVDAAWLDQGWQQAADAAFAEAEDLATGDRALLERVRAARLSADYPALERARLARQPAPPALRARAERFLAAAKACGLTAVRESNGGFEAWEKDLHAALGLDGAK